LIVTGLGQSLYKVEPTLPFIQPFIANVVDPQRLLIGTKWLYESVDQGQTVTRMSQLPQQVKPLAYGGYLNGAPAADIAYVTSGTTLYVRKSIAMPGSPAFSDFTALPNYPGAAINDLVLDPDDWQRGYVLDANDAIYRFENAGAAKADWTIINGD